MTVRWLIRSVVFCVLSLPASAERRGVAVYFDQDMFIPLVNEDRDYTMGVGFEFFEEDDGIYPLEHVLEELGKLVGVDPVTPRMRRSYLLGSVNYTPDDLSAADPVIDDRPYSSVVFLANKRVYADQDTAIGVEAQLGLLGSYIAREVQRKLHRAWREANNVTEPVDPKGWGNQISAGGEPTARVRIARSDLLFEHPGVWDVAGTSDISLGYQTNASIGLGVRAGMIGSPFWSLPYDPINRGNFMPAFGSDEAYLWLAGRIRAVAYDALLQGQFRDSALTFGHSDLKRLVGDVGFGVTMAWQDVQLTLSANSKTSELKRGKADRTHWWGGAYLTVRY